MCLDLNYMITGGMKTVNNAQKKITLCRQDGQLVCGNAAFPPSFPELLVALFQRLF